MAAESSSERTRAYRERMRKKGLRPIEIWVPDVRSREFKEEARRQALAVARSAQEQDDLEFIDSLVDLDD